MRGNAGDLMSRRAFLAGLAAAATAASLDPLQFVRTEGAVYENLRLGLTTRLPSGWEYSSIADFVALRARQVLLDEVAAEHHALKNPEELPVFIFEDPAHRDGHFAPGIVLYDNPVRHVPDDQAAAHLGMLHRLARSYQDLHVTGAPSARVVGGVPSTISRWSYVHEVDNDAWELSVRTVLVFTQDRANTFHLVDDLRSPRIDDATWTEFLGSVRYR